MAEELNDLDVQREETTNPSDRDMRQVKLLRWLGAQLDERTRERDLLLVEVARLRREVEFEANAINLEAESLRDVFLHVGDQVEFHYSEESDEKWRAGVIVSVDPLRVRADDTDNLTTNPGFIRKAGQGPVCACSVDFTALDPERWTRPLCAVHPDGPVDVGKGIASLPEEFHDPGVDRWGGGNLEAPDGGDTR